MIRLYTILRNNWKKTTFITIVGNYGAYRLFNYVADRQMMKENCLIAQRLGDQILPSRCQPRHVTVILNPVSGKRKAKKYYSKFVEPLLHLAGMKVSLIETESPGQAKDIMKIMSDCDCVAVVGGDGTVHEVLNGLLSRSDAKSASKAYPIALIPVGKKNSIAEHIHQKLPQRTFKEFLISSTMSLVQGNAHKFDVMIMKPMSSTENDVQYCLKGLKYGIYQDISTKESDFIPPYIKQYWYMFMRVVRPNKYIFPKVERLEFTKPCLGCTQCYQGHQISDDPITENEIISPKRWWSGLIHISKKTTQTEEEMTELMLTKRENPDCNIWTEIGMSKVSNIEATSVGHSTIKLSLHQDNDFLPSETIQAQNLRIFMNSDDESCEPETPIIKNENEPESNDANSEKLDIEDKRSKFIVDGEPVVCKPIEISTLRNVTIFTGPVNIS